MIVSTDIVIKRAIKRELRSVVYLFDDKNFKDIHVKPGDIPINATLIRNWMTLMMENYCVIFNISCTQRYCFFDEYLFLWPSIS